MNMEAGNKDLELISFYGIYAIGDRLNNKYLIIDMNKKKVATINEEKFSLIYMLNELKKDIKNL